MVILPEYKIRGGESETAYTVRICSMVPLVIESWEDAGQILNDQLNHDYTPDAYRKPYQGFLKFHNALEQDKAIENRYLSELENARIEIQKERQKLSDLTIRYRLHLREQSRFELMVEQIVDAIKSELKTSEPVKPLDKVKSEDRQAVACVADAHDGSEFEIKGLFGETLNKYSPEIFEQRMWQYAEEILAVANKEKLYSWIILDLGDSIEGILRLSSLHFIKFGLSESAVHYAKFMAKWLKYLSRYIYIDYRAISGNHDDLRLLSGKKGDFPAESVQIFISEIIKAIVDDNPNITISPTHENKHIFIRLFDNFNIFAVHGEEKDQSRCIEDYQKLYGVTINMLIGAHKHFSSMEEIGFDKNVARVRSIMGVNNFAESILKSANPGANIFIYEANGRGLRQQYNITFNSDDPK